MRRELALAGRRCGEARGLGGAGSAIKLSWRRQSLAKRTSARLLKKERATFERGDLRARALGTADGEAGAKASGDASDACRSGLLRGAVWSEQGSQDPREPKIVKFWSIEVGGTLHFWAAQ